MTELALFSLDEFQKTLRYEREAPVQEVLKDLQQLQVFDQSMEVEESKWKKRTGWLAAVAVLSVLGTIASFATLLVPLALLTIPAFFLGLFGGIYSGAKWSRFSGLNLENRRLRLPGKLLQYLSHDMSPTQIVRLSIDFRHYRNPAFVKSQTSTGMFSSQKAFQYVIPWLTVRGQLLDGQRFEFSLTTVAKRKEKQKRKYTKVRETFCERLDLSLRVKVARFPKLDSIAGLAYEGKVRTPFQPMKIHAENGVVHLAGTTPGFFRGAGRGTSIENSVPDAGVCTADHALQSFLAAYSAIDLCRG